VGTRILTGTWHVTVDATGGSPEPPPEMLNILGNDAFVDIPGVRRVCRHCMTSTHVKPNCRVGQRLAARRRAEADNTDDDATSTATGSTDAMDDDISYVPPRRNGESEDSVAVDAEDTEDAEDVDDTLGPQDSVSNAGLLDTVDQSAGNTILASTETDVPAPPVVPGTTTTIASTSRPVSPSRQGFLGRIGQSLGLTTPALDSMEIEPSTTNPIPTTTPNPTPFASNTPHPPSHKPGTGPSPDQFYPNLY
jgi:hypothetical protein